MSVTFSREPVHVYEPPRDYMKDPLVDTDLLGDACTLFTQITMEPGSEITVHEHTGECETYYILSGTGIHNDNGNEVEVSAGAVTFCDDGESHGLKNNPDEPLVMIALILKK